MLSGAILDYKQMPIGAPGAAGTTNDYPRIFQILKEAGFQGWISIEDGLNGLEEIRASAEFLRPLMAG